MDELDAILADFRKIQTACQEMGQNKILVGLVGGVDSETMKIAHAHEYGDGKMPERSFIRASFDAEQDTLGEIISDAVGKALMGQTSPEGAAHAIGAQAVQVVQSFIDENRVKPPSDFSKKRIHTTLFETGTHIRDRIAYKVVKE